MLRYAHAYRCSWIQLFHLARKCEITTRCQGVCFLGELTYYRKLPLKGLEPLHLAPEASALSSELQGLRFTSSQKVDI